MPRRRSETCEPSVSTCEPSVRTSSHVTCVVKAFVQGPKALSAHLSTCLDSASFNLPAHACPPFPCPCEQAYFFSFWDV